MSRTWPGRGKRVQLPDGFYEAESRVILSAGVVFVSFAGEDGRARLFSCATWPLPAMHEAIAEAFAVRTGPGGGVNTEQSAKGLWSAARRFLVGLAELAARVDKVSDLDAAATRRWIDHQTRTGRSYRQVMHDAQKIASLLRNVRGGGPSVAAAAEVLFRGPIPDVWDDAEPAPERYGDGVAGYDDETFEWLKAAARADLARRRDEIGRSHRLIRQLRSGHPLESGELHEAELLADIAASGDVAGVLRRRGITGPTDRTRWAAKLYLVEADLAPLLVLFVALSGHNVESVKELPAAHRRVAKNSLSLKVTKRRHGFSSWEEPAQLAIRSGDLSSPGGLYLLVERLCRPSREIAHSDKLIMVWSNGTSQFKVNAFGHHFPWHRSLSAATIALGGWCRHHDPAGLPPFDLTLNRVRTTKLRLDKLIDDYDEQDPPIGVSLEVFYRSYFAPDQRARDWAAGLIALSLKELEQVFRGVNRRHVPGSPNPAAQATETAFAGCITALQNPLTGETCAASFLTCFICPNVVIANRHLPGILRLKEELIERWDRFPRHIWWRRYGPAWIAITHDILPAKSPEQVATATQQMPDETPLRLLEGIAGGSW
ncbi:hypothetical protein ACNUCX_11405 [Curtobacterium flaccumfaciens pv. flaccumfaciens]|uniref:hypothetical protein n=1 Tax=Curtobacterium flaccumfaciens TaxID=2035 RepID=UPI003AB252E4